LKSRLITGLILVLLLIVVLLADSMFLQIVAFLAGALVLYELYKATGIIEQKTIFVMGFLPLAALWLNNPTLIGLFTFIYVVLLFTCLLVMKSKLSFNDIALVFFISYAFVFMIKHLVMVRLMSDIGAIAIWAVFIGACLSDTFAYFCGTLFGKHKLAPSISPKKTVEGSVGAILGTILSFLVYGLVIVLATDLKVNFILIMLLGFVCSVFAQFGDLSASVIKRECQIKDFGSLFPGHGGLMDRLDSILFVAPVVYYLLKMLPVITV